MDPHAVKQAKWLKAVEETEEKALKNIKKARIRLVDYSVVLPKKLRDRVAKIIPYEYDEHDKNVFIANYELNSQSNAKDLHHNSDNDEENDDQPKTKLQGKDDFNESTCSEIEVLQAEHVEFDLKLEEQFGHKLRKEKEVNWMSKYICTTRKDRVIWPTKVYDLEKHNKTLDEQAQELMDATAERFTEWMNSLGNNPSEHMSKETLKALFNIEGDKKLFASIQNDPKEVKAIAQTVADKWNLPEMAIELKYERYIANRLKNLPKKVIKVAFGRCLPYSEIPWLPSKRDGNINTIYPPEILSGEKLFKGIGHLRSVKKMVDFYQHHPELKKPSYMVESGYFKKKTVTSTTGDVPLYERLKLKY